MSSRLQWLDAGLATLAQQGAPAVTIDRLAGLLGLSKGSFYHHFGGMSGYRSALLAHFEDTCTTRYIAAVEQRAEQSPLAKLGALLDLVLGGEDADGGLEVAIRAWAQQDPEVRAAQERVDRMRRGYLRDLWLQASGDEREAERMGQLLYAILVGAGHMIPPIGGRELREVYDLALRSTGVRSG